MTNSKRLRRVARRVKGLLRAPKTNVTVREHPELYYRHVWLEKPYYEAIDFLAKEHGLSKKQALHDLLDLGMGRYIGELVAQQNRQVIEHRARGEPARPTYFTIKLRQNNSGSSDWGLSTTTLALGKRWAIRPALSRPACALSWQPSRTTSGFVASVVRRAISEGALSRTVRPALPERTLRIPARNSSCSSMTMTVVLFTFPPCGESPDGE